MTIEPMHDRVLIKPIEEPPKSSSLMLPQHAKEKPKKGTLVAWGKDFQGIDNPRVGDIVFFHKSAGDEMDLNGETVLIMRESDLVAFIYE